MIRRIRIILAMVFFLGITLMFLDFTGTLHHWLGWMAKIQFLPAALALNVLVIVVLLCLTLVFGRVYCSVICPLGVMQDVFASFGKKVRKNRYSYSKPMAWLRYMMLVIMIVAIVAGVGSIVQLLAPYSAYGRIATMLLQPLWQLGNNGLAAIAERADSYAFYSVDVWTKSLPVLFVALTTMIILFVLAWRNGRTYCNTICPVGTVLGFVARLSFFKVRFDADKCRNCSLCSKNCKASCIDYKNHSVDYSRCVVCGDCIEKCNFGALKYRLSGFSGSSSRSSNSSRSSSSSNSNSSNPQTTSYNQNTTDAPRRSFLVSSSVLLATAAIAQDKKIVDGGLAVIKQKVAPQRQTPLTPPGSLSASNMAKRCTGCQLCVSECPNGVLRPTMDLLHIMQPVMSYERGYCRPECTRCSDVCPAGAIKSLDGAEKSSIQIGHAVWIRKNCLPVADGIECGNCERHCPSGAIEMVPSDPDDETSAYIPVVNEARCIGCGACEYVCPSCPFPAIYVEGHEVHRTI